MHELIDIGANLTHDSFARDRHDIIARAAEAGVRRIIVTGASALGSTSAFRLAVQYPGKLFATAGVHPHHAQQYDQRSDTSIRKLAAEGRVVAIGECGLDYFRNFSPADAQRAAFEAQLQIAIDAQKPVFLHQRDAHEAFLEILRRYIHDIPGGVAHCFTGGKQELEAYLELGLHIGVTGWVCDERRGRSLQDAVPDIPIDRIMLETDAPYLLPRDLHDPPFGRRNVPELLPHILMTVAGLMDESPARIARAATTNAQRLFGLGD